MDDTALARTTDPATSHAAARSVASFAGDHERRILAALARPMTCYELAVATGLDHVAVARRMRRLVETNRAQESGETRPGPNGRQCTVWMRIADEGMAA
jgi:predicted ArsR family transcriptional regulator